MSKSSQTAHHISRLDHKIRSSDQRLLRASVRRGMTAPLDPEHVNTTPLVARFLKYFDIDLTDAYLVLPEQISRRRDFHWLIDLEGLPGAVSPISIQIAGDVVLGMQREFGGKPDLDLAPYGAHLKGVSREHAVIRPTTHHLYLIDMGSRNGTCINTVQVSPAAAKELHNEDLISLGALSFRLRIKQPPKR
jgi:hypothetical protein